MKVVGIDPGKTGAVVALLADERGAGVSVFDAARAEHSYVVNKEYSPKSMANLLFGLRPCTAFLERQHAMPAFKGAEGRTRSQGASTTFAIGYGYGLWVGVLVALGIPVQIVSASVWQKEVLRGVPGTTTKDKAVMAVELRCPSINLKEGRRTHPHLGLADACCLALYGLGAGKETA